MRQLSGAVLSSIHASIWRLDRMGYPKKEFVKMQKHFKSKHEPPPFPASWLASIHLSHSHKIDLSGRYMQDGHTT
jgi:hypothetical protein